MEPETREQERKRRFAALGLLREKGFYAVGGWLFSKNGLTYDFSAADLSQIDRIERKGLFVVTVTDLPVQAAISRAVAANA